MPLRQRRRLALSRGSRNGSVLSWSLVGIEVLAIILGITLGFFVNEWRQDRADRAAGEATLRAVAAEMSLNCVGIRQAHPYYRETAVTLDSLMSLSDESIPFRDVPGWRGLNPILIRTGSYDLGIATGSLGHVPFETADLVSSVYSVQSLVGDALNSATQALLQGSITGDARSFYSYMQIMHELSRSVLYMYEAAERGPLVDYGFTCSESDPPS